MTPEDPSNTEQQDGNAPFLVNLRRRLQAVRTRPQARLWLSLGAVLALALGTLSALAANQGWPSGAATEEDLVISTTEVARPRRTPLVTLEDLPPYGDRPAAGGGILRRVDIQTVIPDRPRLEVIQYTVRKGDTLFGIAERYGLRPETILWGNFEVLQDNPHSLRPGQDLNILPVDGTYYEWSEGDGLEAIASFFEVVPQEIIDWPGNHITPGLDPASQIEPGTWLVIPEGRRDFVSWRAPRITRSNPAVARVAGPGACGSIYDGPIGEGFFVWPTTASFLSGYTFSGFHPGIDIAGSLGNAVYASASGVVVYAGWNNFGYGDMIVVDHGGGWQTLYAHLSQVDVVCGQATFQGNVIGRLGSTGNSTGNHLHFEMQHDTYGKVNPYSFVSP